MRLTGENLADETKETPTESIIVLTDSGQWIATLRDNRIAQICLEALSGFPGDYRLHELPKHPPLIEKE
jgi:hypothetical protein